VVLPQTGAVTALPRDNAALRRRLNNVEKLGVLCWTISPECVTDSFGGCPRILRMLCYGRSPSRYGSSQRWLSSPRYSLGCALVARQPGRKRGDEDAVPLSFLCPGGTCLGGFRRGHGQPTPASISAAGTPLAHLRRHGDQLWPRAHALAKACTRVRWGG
jgi:hypothetical protein